MSQGTRANTKFSTGDPRLWQVDEGILRLDVSLDAGSRGHDVKRALLCV